MFEDVQLTRLFSLHVAVQRSKFALLSFTTFNWLFLGQFVFEFSNRCCGLRRELWIMTKMGIIGENHNRQGRDQNP